MNHLDQTSGDILDLSIRLHWGGIGPVLLESVYKTVLAGKLIENGYSVERQKPIDIEFAGRRSEAAFRIDLLIDQRVLVKLKSVDRLHPAHAKQLLTYLRLTKQPLRLLINSGGSNFEGGIQKARE